VRRDDRLSQFARGVVTIGRDRRILITSLAQAAQFALNGSLNAFLPLYAREVLGLPVAQLGWLFGVQTLATLAARPLMGSLSDRVGRRSMIVVGLAASSAAVLFISAAENVQTLFAAAIAYAAGLAVTTAATSAHVTDLAHGTRFGAAHGIFGTIYDVGDALGPITAGLLVAGVGYARMFQIMAGAAMAMAAVFAISSRQPAAEAQPA